MLVVPCQECADFLHTFLYNFIMPLWNLFNVNFIVTIHDAHTYSLYSFPSVPFVNINKRILNCGCSVNMFGFLGWANLIKSLRCRL